MNRTHIAALILLAFIAASAVGHRIVFDTTNQLQDALSDIRSCAERADCKLAEQKLQRLIDTYQSRQPALKVFLRRDTASAVCVNLHVLYAYAQSCETQELLAEIDRLTEQLNATEQLFFSIL